MAQLYDGSSHDEVNHLAGRSQWFDAHTSGHSASMAETVPRRWRARARLVITDVATCLRGRDIAASAATLTFFAGIAIVPWFLWATWSIRWVDGVDDARRHLSALRVLIPPDMGARPVYDELVDAGTHVGLIRGLVLAFPASFYGEGLRRACLSLRVERERFTGWRARISVLGLLIVVPPIAWVSTAALGHLTTLGPDGGGRGGIADLALRVYLTFLIGWIAVSALLAYVYRLVTPGRPRWWAALVGATTTASFLAGLAQGFVLFLSLPIDVGIPYAGLRVIGGVVAVGLWLWIAHMVVLIGWALTVAVDSRGTSSRSAGEIATDCPHSATAAVDARRSTGAPER